MWRQPEGVTWKPLDLTQLTKDDVRLVHLSLSSDAVWAVDAAGAVWDRFYETPFRPKSFRTNILPFSGKFSSRNSRQMYLIILDKILTFYGTKGS
jgi:hypothetical protein